jgi:hypothetical protein
MGASGIPVEAIVGYLESQGHKMIQGGIPAERVLDAMKLAAVRLQTHYATTAAVMTGPRAEANVPSDGPIFAAVLERLRAEPQNDSPIEDRPERRKAGRPWWKSTAKSDLPLTPRANHFVMPDAARVATKETKA